MDRFDAMRLFVRIVERRSFTAAANDMEIPRSTATKVIAEMEARLGVRLGTQARSWADIRHVALRTSPDSRHRQRTGGLAASAVSCCNQTCAVNLIGLAPPRRHVDGEGGHAHGYQRENRT
ncbi:hypothetical protein XEUV490_08050 [Xanthomonas euvesicatoria]|nr:hypothetical protein XEUV490_08050 [Xanthomonas euvesicatoria]KLB96299.1 hypothetical protein XEUV678_09120 [Xanthomonas euvesicatoria]OCG86499.1 hypothetical protein LMG667_10995 [Xanthomonas euvesicatoria]